MRSETQVLSDIEAAKILGLSPSTLRKWRTGRPCRGPAFLRMGRRVGYRVADIEAWAADQVVSTCDSSGVDRNLYAN